MYKTGKRLAVVMKSLAKEPNANYILIGWHEPSTIYYLNPGNKKVIEAAPEKFSSYMNTPNTVIAVTNKYFPAIKEQLNLHRPKDQPIIIEARNFVTAGKKVTFYIFRS